MNLYNSQEELLKKIQTIPVDHRDDPKEVITSTLKSYNELYGYVHGEYVYYKAEEYTYADIWKIGLGKDEIIVNI